MQSKVKKDYRIVFLRLFFSILFLTQVFSESIDIVAVSESGNYKALKEAISKGADVNQKDKYEKTALHVCALEDYDELAELLISSGADINTLSKWGDTPLHIACACGSMDTIKLLLAKGANATIRNNDGFLPSDMAAKEGHPEIVKLLSAK